MNLASTYERSNRSAPARNFSGGHVDHGPIVNDLVPYYPRRELIGGALVSLAAFAIAFAFAAMTP